MSAFDTDFFQDYLVVTLETIFEIIHSTFPTADGDWFIKNIGKK